MSTQAVGSQVYLTVEDSAGTIYAGFTVAVANPDVISVDVRNNVVSVIGRKVGTSTITFTYPDGTTKSDVIVVTGPAHDTSVVTLDPVVGSALYRR